MKKIHITHVTLPLLLVTLLNSCGSKDAALATVATSQITGRAALGPLKNATVKAVKIDALGNEGVVLGTATTGQDGSYTINVSETGSEPFIIKAYGGTFVDEATNTTKTISEANAVTTLVSPEDVEAYKTKGIGITQLSSIAHLQTIKMMKAESSDATDFQALKTKMVKSKEFLTAAYGADPLLEPEDINGAGFDPTTEKGNLALKLAGMAVQVNKMGIDFKKYDELIAADAIDGKINGQVGSLTLTFKDKNANQFAISKVGETPLDQLEAAVVNFQNLAHAPTPAAPGNYTFNSAELVEAPVIADLAPVDGSEANLVAVIAEFKQSNPELSMVDNFVGASAADFIDFTDYTIDTNGGFPVPSACDPAAPTAIDCGGAIAYVEDSAAGFVDPCSTDPTLCDPYSGDTTAPIAPSALGFVEASPHSTTIFTATWSNSASLDISHQVISFFTDPACSISEGTSATYGPGINSHVFSAGSHGSTYYYNLSITDMAGNSTVSACSAGIAIDTTVGDVTAPSPASGLAFLEASPYNATSVNANWTLSLSGDLNAQTIDYYASANCSGPIDSTFSLSSAVNTHNLATALNGMSYSFVITSTDLAGNSQASACSSPISIDTSAPLDATALTWIEASPHNATMVNSSWMLSVSGDVVSQEVNYYPDGICGGAPIFTSSALPPSITSDFFTGADLMTYSFTVTTIDSAGNSSISSCSSPMQIAL